MRQHVSQVVVGLLEPDAQRMAVNRFEAGNLLVVVEPGALLRRVGEFVQADDLALDQPRPRRAQAGVDQPLERVDEIFGDELAMVFADILEPRVVR